MSMNTYVRKRGNGGKRRQVYRDVALNSEKARLLQMLINK